MGEKNYKLIYDLRHQGLKVESLANLQVQFRNEADAKAREEFKKLTDFLEKHLGHDRFEVTNICCMADGVLSHVYTWDEKTKPPADVGKKRCVFCGCDDFDI